MKNKKDEKFPAILTAPSAVKLRERFLFRVISRVSRETILNESVSHGVPRAARGFSLVEISLALLVVAIGMLSILGMFPSGLDQNARSISDTHAALFAEEVFSSLRVNAETNWQKIGSADIINLPAAASNNWHPDYDLRIWLNNQLSTNIYRHPNDLNIVDHAFRYRITLTTNGLIKSAFLRFWPGEFGTASNPAVFYSEFFRMNP